MKNRAILNKPDTKGVPVYYVICNHEIDCYHLENVLKFYSLDTLYYFLSITSYSIKY